jgi:hypothetical protein
MLPKLTLQTAETSVLSAKSNSKPLETSLKKHSENFGNRRLIRRLEPRRERASSRWLHNRLNTFLCRGFSTHSSVPSAFTTVTNVSNPQSNPDTASPVRYPARQRALRLQGTLPSPPNPQKTAKPDSHLRHKPAIAKLPRNPIQTQPNP